MTAPLRRMRRQTSLISQIWLLILMALWIGLRTVAGAERPPNIVFIFADDLGVNDLSCYGRMDQRTPNLDLLASQGTRFTCAYCAQPICSASRAAVMTGMTSARLHLTTFLPGRPDCPSQKLLHPRINMQLPSEQQTIAELLKPAGYVSACIGKWHLGGKGFGPEDQGFDVVHVGRADTEPTASEGGKGEYDLTTAAEKFIADHRDRPFLLYVPHNNPHIPLRAKPELIEKYKDSFNPIYAAMVETLDDSVGRLLSKLDEFGLTNKTIFVFSSDHGGLHVQELPHTPATHNTPFRAGKGYLYEGGLRVPLIVRWPQVIPAGRVVASPVLLTDLVPTWLELCGIKSDVKFDGVDLSLLFRGGEQPARTLHWHFPHYTNQGSRPAGAVRQENWKLIEHYEDGRLELFDLTRDISETTNLAPQMPDRARELQTSLSEWRDSIGAQQNTLNPDFDSALHKKLYIDIDTSQIPLRPTAAEMAKSLAEWRTGMDAVLPKPKR